MIDISLRIDFSLSPFTSVCVSRTVWLWKTSPSPFVQPYILCFHCSPFFYPRSMTTLHHLFNYLFPICHTFIIWQSFDQTNFTDSATPKWVNISDWHFEKSGNAEFYSTFRNALFTCVINYLQLQYGYLSHDSLRVLYTFIDQLEYLVITYNNLFIQCFTIEKDLWRLRAGFLNFSLKGECFMDNGSSIQMHVHFVLSDL